MDITNPLGFTDQDVQKSQASNDAVKQRLKEMFIGSPEQAQSLNLPMPHGFTDEDVKKAQQSDQAVGQRIKDWAMGTPEHNAFVDKNPILPKISIGTPAAAKPKLAVDPGNTPTPLPDNDAAHIAEKANFGLGGRTGHDYDTLKQSIKDGSDKDIRAQAAVELDSQRNKKVLQQLAITPYIDVSKLMVKTDPDSVFEREFARTVIGTHVNNPGQPGEWWHEMATNWPQQVQGFGEVASDILTKNAYFSRKAAEYRAREFNMGWAKWLATKGFENIFPLYGEVKERGGIGEHLGLGDQLAHERDTMILDQPFDVAKDYADKRLEEIGSLDPGLAADWAEDMAGTSVDVRYLKNFFTAVNVATTPGWATVAKGTYNVMIGKAFQDIVKSAGTTANRSVATAVAEGSGDLPKTGILRVKEITTKGFMVEGDPGKEAIDQLTSVLRSNAEDIKLDPGNAANNVVNKMLAENTTLTAKLMGRLKSTMRVMQIKAPLALDKVVQSIYEDVRNKYPHINNAILDIGHPYYVEATNSYLIPTFIGQFDGSLFKTPEEAAGFADTHGLTGKVHQEQYGSGFYLQVWKPLDHTQNVIRDNLISTSIPDSEAPYSHYRQLASWLRTPEETLSVDENINRHLATVGPTQFLDLLKDAARDIQKMSRRAYPLLGKKKWDQFVQALDAAKRTNDPNTNEIGYFYKSPGELDKAYVSRFGRTPSAQEYKAYFAYRDLYEMDRVFRNILKHNLISRVGAEQFSIKVLNAEGKMINSKSFNAVPRTTIPRNEEVTMMVAGDTVGKEQIKAVTKFGPKTLQKFEDMAQKGEIRILEVHAPDEYPLTGFGKVKDGDRIGIVVARELESKPLDWIQVPQRGGGHFEYAYNRRIAQAIIKKDRSTGHWWYNGMQTLAPMGNRAMAEKFLKNLDRARVLWGLETNKSSLVPKGSAESEIAKIAGANGINWKEFKTWFSPQRAPDGTLQPARFDLYEPFRVVEKNEDILSTYRNEMEGNSRYLHPQTGKTMLRDGTTQGSLSRMSQVAYTQPRDSVDLWSVRDVGTKYNPVWKYEPAQYVDPFETMNRGLSRITQSVFLDEYKVDAVEHWNEQAYRAGILRTDINRLRASPLYYFHAPEYVPRNPNNFFKLQFYKANNFKIRQFVGISSDMAAVSQGITQKLLDSIYRGLGPKAEAVADWMLPTVIDPVRFMRNIAFHKSMGLFAMPQLLLHASTILNGWAISGPMGAMRGGLGALLHFWASFTDHPNVLKALDNIASTTRLFKPGEWSEARENLVNSGFMHEAGTHVLRDDVFSNKVIKNLGSTVLDMGTFPFRAGLKSMKAAAWYTAHSEVSRGVAGKISKTVGAFKDMSSREARARTLARADLLSHNMTRASSSVLHTGWTSLPSQFYSYFLRLTEIATGKRLTPLERTRLYATNAIMYGLPAATALSGVPYLEKYIRRTAMDKGYVTGNNWFSDTIMNGLPSMLTNLISGGGDLQLGTAWNIADRYGPKSLLTDAIDRDETLLDILGGASLQSGIDFLSSAGPMWQWVSMNMPWNYDKDHPYKMKSDYVLNLLRNSAAFNQDYSAWMAINAGKWMSKNQNILDQDVTTSQALVRSITGMRPQQDIDSFDRGINSKSRKALIAESKQKFAKDWKLALRAMDQEFGTPNPQQANDFMNNAWSYTLNIPDDEILATVQQASRDYGGTVPSRMNWNFFVIHPPKGKEEVFRKIFSDSPQLHEGNKPW
jgi:hypothetical protein